MDGLGVYFKAFNELTTERSVGMALGPIPWHTIVKWAEVYGVEDIDTLTRYVWAMDNAQRKFLDRDKQR